jgi:beta-phosphoglucomutase-like phosphatase (HAD superfamily)
MIGHFEFGQDHAILPADQWFDLTQTYGFGAVIFDCDGTLVRSEEAHFRALQRAVGNQDQHLDRAWYLGRTGLDRRGLLQEFRRTQAPTLDVERAIGDSIAGFSSEVWRVEAIAQTVDLATRLSNAKIPLAVGTNSERFIARQSLGKIDVLGLFPIIACVSDTLAAKPSPDIFLAAATSLQIPAYKILVVEDSREGVVAAKAANMAVLRIESAAP